MELESMNIATTINYNMQLTYSVESEINNEYSDKNNKQGEEDSNKKRQLIIIQLIIKEKIIINWQKDYKSYINNG